MSLEKLVSDLMREQRTLLKEVVRLREVVSKVQDADVRLHLGRGQRIAIVAGVFTPSAHSYFRVAAETGTVDEITTITATHAGHVIILGPALGPHTITLKHATGNIQLAGSDIVLDTAYKTVMLMYSAGLQAWLLTPNY